MQTEIQLETYRTDISQLAESVFLSMLNLEVQTSDAKLPADAVMLTGAVYYAGPWKGAVLLQCSHEQAIEFTTRLIRIARPESINDDVRDAMGELTNILGGNLKPLLPRGVALSSPSVVEGSPSVLRVCVDSPIIRLAFESALGVFWLTVIGLPD